MGMNWVSTAHINLVVQVSNRDTWIDRVANFNCQRQC